VIIGELSDADAIDRAVAGADAVVSAVGPSLDRKATGMPVIEGTRHILDAMKRHSVTRYVGHATPSILDPHEKPTLQTKWAVFYGADRIKFAVSGADIAEQVDDDTHLSRPPQISN
jgi:nucleoside-diphosphate-sugar epimerase